MSPMMETVILMAKWAEKCIGPERMEQARRLEQLKREEAEVRKFERKQYERNGN